MVSALREAPGHPWATPGYLPATPWPSQGLREHKNASRCYMYLSKDCRRIEWPASTKNEGSDGETVWASRKRPYKSQYSFTKWICVFTMLGTVCPSTFSGHGFYEVSVSQTLKFFRKRSPKFEHVWRFGRHTLHHSRTPAISGSTFLTPESAGSS